MAGVSKRIIGKQGWEKSARNKGERPVAALLVLEETSHLAQPAHRHTTDSLLISPKNLLTIFAQ